MLAHSVSPPTLGMIWQRRIVYLVGHFRNVVSLCHTSVDSTGLSLWLSSTRISGNSPCGRIGWTSSSPNARLIATCCAVVEVLLAHVDDLVLDQGGFEGLECRRIPGLHEIDAADFRAEPCAHAFHFERGRCCRLHTVGCDVDVHGCVTACRPPSALVCCDYGTMMNRIKGSRAYVELAIARWSGNGKGAVAMELASIPGADGRNALH